MHRHHDTSSLVDKAVGLGAFGARNLVFRLHNEQVPHDEAVQAVEAFAKRKDVAPEPLLAHLDKRYKKPFPSRPDAQAAATSVEPTVETGFDILNHDFGEEEDWYVEPFVHRGLTILGGPSKIGKSVFAHNLAHAVITSKPLSGYESDVTGKVLWINLEERRQEVQSKLKCAWTGEEDRPKLADLHIVHEMPHKLMDGGDQWLRQMLSRDNYVFLVLDSLTAASSADGRKDVFQRDYDRVQSVKRWFRWPRTFPPRNRRQA
jgi:hypothetical protein